MESYKKDKLDYLVLELDVHASYVYVFPIVGDEKANIFQSMSIHSRWALDVGTFSQTKSIERFLYS